MAVPVTREVVPAPADPAAAAGASAGPERGGPVGTVFGLVAIVLEVARGADRAAPGERSRAVLLDAAMGAAWSGARLASRGAELAGRVAAPVVGLVLDPPLVPGALHPRRPLEALAGRWRSDRATLARQALRSTRDAAPPTVGAAVRLVDIDAVLAAAVDEVDVDALVARVVARMDLTAAAEAALAGLDVEALAAATVSRVQLDPLVARVVAEVDTVAAVERVMAALPADDLVAAVVAHLDMPALIRAALQQVDLTPIVVESVDLGAVVAAALDEVDLTALVVERVDLARVVTAALDGLDVTRIVMERVDLPLVASTVIDQIDLAGTIRDSTGSVATEAVRGVRLTSVDADRAVARLVDRFTLRRRGRSLDAPGDPESLSGAGQPVAVEHSPVEHSPAPEPGSTGARP